MTPLSHLDNAIYARTVLIAHVSPARAASVLVAQGWRRECATAAAHGALAGMESTKLLAKRIGLVTQ